MEKLVEKIVSKSAETAMRDEFKRADILERLARMIWYHEFEGGNLKYKISSYLVKKYPEILPLEVKYFDWHYTEGTRWVKGKMAHVIANSLYYQDPEATKHVFFKQYPNLLGVRDSLGIPVLHYLINSDAYEEAIERPELLSMKSNRWGTTAEMIASTLLYLAIDTMVVAREVTEEDRKQEGEDVKKLVRLVDNYPRVLRTKWKDTLRNDLEQILPRTITFGGAILFFARLDNVDPHWTFQLVDVLNRNFKQLDSQTRRALRN